MVTMLKDAVFTDTCIVTGTVTLDMNGHTISNTSSIWVDTDEVDKWSLISVRGNGNLTITGNGTLSTLENDIYAVDIYDATSSCTIESGTFIGNIHAVYVFNGSLTVNGGAYSIQQVYPDSSRPYEFVLNCYDDSREAGTAKITVTGGTFENFNPADCTAEGEGTNFVAEGYTVTSEKIGEDTWYTVVPLTAENSAAEVNGVYYENLTDAIAAADGETVTVLEDTTVAPDALGDSWREKTVTIDLNQKTVTISAGGSVSVGPVIASERKNVTVDAAPGESGNCEKTDVTLCNGTVIASNAAGTNANFAIETGHSLTLDGVDGIVTVSANGSVFLVRGNEATLNIRNSNISTSGVYVIGTNASDAEINGGVKISVEKSTLSDACDTGRYAHDNCAVMINVPGKLSIKDSTITAERQGVFVRSGTVNIENTTITTNSKYLNYGDYCCSKPWEDGDEAPYGALIIGKNDKGTGNTYQGDISVTLANCTLSANADANIGVHYFALFADKESSANDNVNISGTVTVKAGRVVNKDNSVTMNVTGANIESAVIPTEAATETDIETEPAVESETEDVTEPTTAEAEN